MKLVGKRAAAAVGVVSMVAALSGCLHEGVNRIGSGAGKAVPGLYTTSIAAGQRCFWYRLSSPVSKPSAIIVSNFSGSGGRVFARVLPSDKAFQSIGCGTWTLAKSTSYNRNRFTAQSGDYRIPTDLLPGTYHSAGGRICYWKRVVGWTGGNNVIIANAYKGPQTVTIAKTDAGFSSSNCANWTRVK